MFHSPILIEMFYYKTKQPGGPGDGAEVVQLILHGVEGRLQHETCDWRPGFMFQRSSRCYGGS